VLLFDLVHQKLHHIVNQLYKFFHQNNGTLWESYGLDGNSLTISFLYSNFRLLNIECSSIFSRYHTNFQQQQQLSIDELSNSTELVRPKTHFSLTYFSDIQHLQDTHCFPLTSIDQKQELNGIVK
jgi:hypothetical protein